LESKSKITGVDRKKCLMFFIETNIFRGG